VLGRGPSLPEPSRTPLPGPPKRRGACQQLAARPDWPRLAVLARSRHGPVAAGLGPHCPFPRDAGPGASARRSADILAGPLASALRLAAAPRLPAAAPTPLGLPPAHRPLAPEGAPSGPLGAPAARGSLQGTALPCSVPPPPRSRGPRRHLRSSPAPHSPLPGPAARLPAATTACPPPSTQPILSLGANERQPISGQGEEEKTHSDRGARVTGASLPPTEGGAGLPAIAASQEGRKAPPVRQGPAPCGEAPPSRPEAPC